MTWEIAVGIITLAGAGISVGKVIFDLSRTLTKLDCSVEGLNRTLSGFVSENEDEHGELYGELSEVYEQLSVLEKRLSEVESRGSCFSGTGREKGSL